LILEMVCLDRYEAETAMKASRILSHCAVDLTLAHNSYTVCP
jgi:hypothetical protein